MADEISASDRALIDNHIKKHGVTKCQIGAMATVPEYVWQPRKGCGGWLRPTTPQNWKSDNGAAMKNRARAARLRRAEADQ
jgi:hypothetical protein